MHDKLANKIENKTEEREEDTEKFYVAEEGVPLYICDQNALICLLRKRNRIEPDDCIAPGRWNLFGKTSAAGRRSSLFGVWKGPAVFRCLLFTGRNS